MRFPPHLLDEIRARLPVSHVVGRRVNLRKQGREFIGLSPFNAEKTPSFTVNDQKGFYHCFSSGKHGDIFRFVTETEGLSFPEAVERLAAEAGVPLPRRDPRAEQEASEREDLYSVVEMAAVFFLEQLHAAPGTEARAYLARRGLSQDTMAAFRIGYAPDGRSALREYLAAKGVSKEDMVKAGLLIDGDDIPVAYDRVRGRVMFPITDLRDRVIAFGGRALSSDVPAKYLNSPQTPLFNKGRMLFNGGNARQAAHDGAPVIAVEGYMDVIALAAAGFRGAVAPLGTALTEDQLSLLWRWCDEPVLCFDGDKAGLRAAGRAIGLALPKLEPGKSLQFALLPEGADPDDLIREKGPGAFQSVLDSAVPLIDVLWQRELSEYDLSTPERRAKFESRIYAAAGEIRHPTVQTHYRQVVKTRLRDLFFAKPQTGTQTGRSGSRGIGGRMGTVDPLHGMAKPLAPATATSRVAAGLESRPSEREAVILAAVINHPVLFERHLESFASIGFSFAPFAALSGALLDIIAENPDLDAGNLQARLRDAGLGAPLEKVFQAITHPSHWWISTEAAEADAETAWTRVVTLHHKEVTLNKELRAAERALGENPTGENWERLLDIKAQIESVSGTEALVEGFGTNSGRFSEAF